MPSLQSKRNLSFYLIDKLYNVYDAMVSISASPDITHESQIVIISTLQKEFEASIARLSSGATISEDDDINADDTSQKINIHLNS